MTALPKAGKPPRKAVVCSISHFNARLVGIESPQTRACAMLAVFWRSSSFVCWVSLALIAGILPVAADTRRVVLLFDERVELPGMSRLDAEFVRTLRANLADPVEVYREPMDLSRFGSDKYKSSLRDFLRIKYADKKIDVAVAVMAPAFDFLSRYGEIIFPGTPIVFCGLDRKQLGNRPLPPNWYGVLVKREFTPTLDVVLRIHPKTREIVVVSGTSEYDETISAAAQNDFRAYESRVAFTYLSDLPFQSLLAILSHLPSDNIVYFTTLFQDGAGKPFTPHEALERISTATSVPIYASADDQYLGRGIVGGRLYSFASHGAATAKLVFRVLSGSEPSQAVSELTSTKIMFDWRQMQRWGISEHALPSGAEIYNREQSIFEQYRLQILVVLAVILTQSLLIAGLVYERRRAYTAELEARKRMSELAHVNRYTTAGQLTAAIAHELNQPLGAILANAESLEAMLKSPSLDRNELMEIAADIRRDDQRAGDVIKRLRALLSKAPFELQQIDLNEIARETLGLLAGLAAARQVKINDLRASSSIRIKGDRIQLQQVLLNLIVNAMEAMSDKPNSERRIDVLTASKNGLAEVVVRDNGSGIPANKLSEIFEPFSSTKPNGMGIGLSIARTIVEAHKGRICAENREEGGASFRVSLPLS